MIPISKSLNNAGKHIGSAILEYTLAFLITATIITSIILLSWHTDDNRTVETSIRNDLEQGSLVFPPVYERNLKTGIDTWVDCEVVEIATYGEKDFIAALTRADWIGYFDKHPCINLNLKIARLPIQNRGEDADYWRYWWGSVALLNIAVGILGMSLPSYQAALKLITYCVIFSAAGMALIRYRQAALLFFPVAFALTFGFAIPIFGQSIGHAPSLIVGLMLLLVYMVAGVDRAALRWQFVYLFVAGGLTFYFDLFNGNLIAVLICFALIRLVSICYSGPPRIFWPTPAAVYPTAGAIVHVMTAYVSGAVSMALFRIVLRAILNGQNLLNVLSEWHAQIAKWKLSGTLYDVLRGVYHNLDAATFPYIGRHTTVLLYALCAMVYLAVIIWVFRNRGRLALSQKDRLLAAFLIAAVVPLEYCAFAGHDIVNENFWMTGRLLSLLFALAVSIAFLAYKLDLDPPSI